jgi:hypothetical protein
VKPLGKNQKGTSPEGVTEKDAQHGWDNFFSKIYYCSDHDNKTSCLPFGACIILLSVTGGFTPRYILSAFQA